MRALRIAFVVILLVLGVILPPSDVSAGTPPPYVVIVNPTNTESVLDRTFVEDAFLKKVTRWKNDDVIHPVDLGPESPVRRRFTEDVLKRSVAAVRIYWQQIIFSGRDIPPPELDTDDEVVKYVLKHPGSIGYISGTASTGGAKVVTVSQ